MNIGFKPANPQLNKSHPLARDLVICLPFEDRGGDTHRDYSNLHSPYPEDSASTHVRGALGGATSFAASVRHVDFGQSDLIALPTRETTICIIYEKNDGTNRNSGIFGHDSGSLAFRIGVHGPWSDGTVYWDFGGNSGANRITASGQTFERAIWVYTAGPRGMEIWKNGSLLSSSSTAVTRTTTTIDYGLGQHGSVNGDNVTYHYFCLFTRQLERSEVLALSADPFSLIIPDETIAYIIQAVGGVTGTSSITLPLPTLESTGIAANVGTSSINLPLPTLSATGLASTAITGTSAINLPLPTLEATGISHSDILGLSLIILPLPILSASGHTQPGTSSITLPLPTMSASGNAVNIGTSSIDLPLPTMSATGLTVTAVTGTSSITLPLPTLSATGLASTAVTGTSAITLPLPTLEASSVVLVDVCTNIELGTPLVFLACDDIKITIDGPAANTVRISSTVEFEA